MRLRTEALDQGLTSEEYDRICEAIGREPNRVELGIFAVMWSEHCCYKSSKIHLKKLPTKGPQVVLGPGENAGVIDLGADWLLAFKVESHNHPSFIEPYQGAATGVGGILRDIFTMGARPIAILDSIHFGAPGNSKTSFLVHGVVGGIGGYGNCMGIPTVGGEVVFDESYNGNNLVNAMAVGVAHRGDLQKGIAKGHGNRVIYLGSKTGRDGIHGATMASQEFGAGNEERRPTVQVGDPFTEKLLLEATLEMAREKLLVGIQDMGAAGIACSTFEMSARGKSGMAIELDRVPVRARGIGAYEMFLSESQERMLLVAEPEKTDRIFEIAKKWGIDCVDIGEVTSTGRVVAQYHWETVVDLPVYPVTDEAPVYKRPTVSVQNGSITVDPVEFSGVNYDQSVREFVSLPNVASKRRIYEQYDSTVGADTVIGPGSDAAVLRIKGLPFGIALTLDSNAFFCSADPYLGTVHTVAEAVRNLACVGAKAVAATNCLNFGNPEDPAVMEQLKESIRGLGDACTVLQTPITGGNVSLYNQTGDRNIRPTPTIGMVGFIADATKAISTPFKREGSCVALLGKPAEPVMYECEFGRSILKRAGLACPPIDLHFEQSLQRALLQLADEELLESCHDVSSGGLFLAALESCYRQLHSPLGIRLSVPNDCHPVLFLFGEFAGRVLVSFKEELLHRMQMVAKNHAVPFQRIGTVGGNTLSIKQVGEWPLDELSELHSAFLEQL